jgi:short-subunit dehydrogenase
VSDLLLAVGAVTVQLKASRVLLTGATGGIGEAIARTLHARGSHLMLSGRKADVLERLRGELGQRAEVIEADLAERADLMRLVTEAQPVDVLVANAALPGTGRLDSFTPEEIDRTLDVNLRAPIQLARALASSMVERGAGHIVLISSLAGKIPSPDSSIYCATKFGLRGFGYSLNVELGGTGVGVTTVFPGFIRDAGMFADSRVKLPPGVGTSSPQDVADAVVAGIEKNKAEVNVAPMAMRSGARLFGAAPGVVVALGRRLGGERLAAAVAEGQRDKRA